MRKELKSVFKTLPLLVLSFSMRPALCAVALPYYEGFESGIEGWTFESYMGIDTNELISASAKHSGEKGYISQGSHPWYTISPELSGTENGLNVTFYYLCSRIDCPGSFQVGYSTSTNETASFTWGEEIITNKAYWMPYSNNFPPGTKYIAIKNTSFDTEHIYIDDFVFSALENYAIPTYVNTSNITTISATLSWASDANSWDIKYKSISEVDWTEVNDLTEKTYTINGLDQGSDYLFCIRANYDGNNHSSWTSIKSFKTILGAVTLPFTEDFEYGADYWTHIYEGADYNNVSNISRDYYRSGSYSFQFYHNSSFNDADYIISPELSGTENGITASFYYRWGSMSYGYFRIGFSLTSNDFNEFYWIDEVAVDNETWKLYSTVLPAGTKYVAIRCTSIYTSYIAFDDFSFTTHIGESKPLFFQPDAIGTNSIQYRWFANNDNYEFRYKPLVPTTSFENGTDIYHYGDGWTSIDADNDGYSWKWSNNNDNLPGNNGSDNMVYSESYNNQSGALTPDNYLVSPQINLGGSISFYAKGHDNSYFNEHFAVAVSTAGNTDPEDFVTIKDWVATDDWELYSADLSNYSGQGYVAIRHYSCTDNYLLDVDDITITEPDESGWTTVNNIDQTTYKLQGLNPSTAYIAQVRGLDGITPTNWCSYAFTTRSSNQTALSEIIGVKILNALAGESADVTFTRSFTTNIASTICLPFELSAAQAEEAGKFYTFAGVDQSNEDWVVIMQEELPSNRVSGALSANVPYLFIPSRSRDIEFSGSIDNIPVASTPIDQNIGMWTFKGTYERINWKTDPHYIYGFAAARGDSPIDYGSFFRTSGGSKSYILPFRAYLQYNPPAGAPSRNTSESNNVTLPSKMTVRLLGANGSPTCIGTLDIQTGQVIIDTWYTIDGKKLEQQPTKNGLYIHNGSKELINQ